MRITAIAAWVAITASVGNCAIAQPSMPKLPKFGGGFEVDDRGAQPPNDPDLLKVAATRPIIVQRHDMPQMFEPHEGMFRIAFRVNATVGQVPFSTIGYGGFRSDYVLDWNAFSSVGVRCVMVKDHLFGVDAYSAGTIGAADSISHLLRQDGAGAVASSTRATIITADFSCDGRIRPSERITVQIKFFALGPRGWRTANYSFDDLELGSNG